MYFPTPIPSNSIVKPDVSKSFPQHMHCFSTSQSLMLKTFLWKICDIFQTEQAICARNLASSRWLITYGGTKWNRFFMKLIRICKLYTADSPSHISHALNTNYNLPFKPEMQRSSILQHLFNLKKRFSKACGLWCACLTNMQEALCAAWLKIASVSEQLYCVSYCIPNFSRCHCKAIILFKFIQKAHEP